MNWYLPLAPEPPRFQMLMLEASRLQMKSGSTQPVPLGMHGPGSKVPGTVHPRGQPEVWTTGAGVTRGDGSTTGTGSGSGAGTSTGTTGSGSGAGAGTAPICTSGGAIDAAHPSTPLGARTAATLSSSRTVGLEAASATAPASMN